MWYCAIVLSGCFCGWEVRLWFAWGLHAGLGALAGAVGLRPFFSARKRKDQRKRALKRSAKDATSCRFADISTSCASPKRLRSSGAGAEPFTACNEIWPGIVSIDGAICFAEGFSVVSLFGCGICRGEWPFAPAYPASRASCALLYGWWMMLDELVVGRP